ncbi:UDP-N-acetyl-D-glucosamine dehydrogenase [Arthrobacter sp. MYb211]|uniref:nucleotide sugar dehydrogenase n=1 Tax=Micrococcaceae TaxID=1268 RepID=UPI000CFD7F49|nr:MULTISPECIES: nucleotide sugar dehydrogenase [unclassified Arthrobacter]PRA14107.1 UDP-N-acetyl-D-glucosamine dehydrogenase [Arthrobacter sp. MYb221]PRC06535.1 UDP-N-acetyl-D-glucosamine dehydrogenase [Arthrobacter sp. MYb211]
MQKLVVVGQGYVGLPLSQGAAHAGLQVTGLELNTTVVENLNNGISHVDDISNDDLSVLLDKGYRASSDPSVIADADVVVICVPTPLGEAGSPDLGAVIGATKTIRDNLSGETLVVLESTTYPGTTEEICLPILTENGAVLDQDLFLAFSPERIDPGNQTYGLKNTPKVVGGMTEVSGDRAVAFYSQFVDSVVRAKGAKEAETAKLLENTYRHINIALVNEMSKFCNDMDIDLWDVINAAKTKPFGFQAFYPGPGVGGHCIPIDPNYLSYSVRKSLGYPFRFVELAEEINASMPRYVVDRVQNVLNESGKALKNSKVLLLGVTYKPDIADQRHSPALPVAEAFLERGADISFHDPKIGEWFVGDKSFNRVESLEDAVANVDVVVLLQNHVNYNTDALANASKAFFDTRGVSTGDAAERL